MNLTQREKEIVHLVASELTTKEIASQLFISDHTVISHRKNLMEKLQVKNVAGLVRRGFESGILRSTLSGWIIILFCSISAIGQDPSIGLEVDVAHDVVFGTSLGEEEGRRLHWSPKKSAFRVGYYDNAQWSDEETGNCSIALGCENSARGQYGMTWGNFTAANAMSSTVWGQYNYVQEGATLSTVWGKNNEATAELTTAFGENNRAGGYGSTVLGLGNVAKGYTSLVTGTYCDSLLVADQSGLFESTPLFIIGNGSGVGANPRSNALSVFASGRMKMGSGEAQADLHIHQSQSNDKPGTGGIILQNSHANFNKPNWQIYNSGSEISFARDTTRVAYINSFGSFIDAVNFAPDDDPITKAKNISTSDFLKIRIGSHTGTNKIKEPIKVDAHQFLKEFPEMIVYDEKGTPFGIDYRQLYLMAIASLQEEIKTNQRQQEEIDALKVAILK